MYMESLLCLKRNHRARLEPACPHYKRKLRLADVTTDWPTGDLKRRRKRKATPQRNTRLSRLNFLSKTGTIIVCSYVITSVCNTSNYRIITRADAGFDPKANIGYTH